MRIKINLDNVNSDTIETHLEDIFEQIYWHLKRHVNKTFNLSDSNGNIVGTVEMNAAKRQTVNSQGAH